MRGNRRTNFPLLDVVPVSQIITSNWTLNIYDTNGRIIYNKEMINGDIFPLGSGVLFPGIYYFTVEVHEDRKNSIGNL